MKRGKLFTLSVMIFLLLLSVNAGAFTGMFFDGFIPGLSPGEQTVYNDCTINTPYILSSSNGTEFLFYGAEDGLYFAQKNGDEAINFQNIFRTGGTLRILDAKMYHDVPTLLVQIQYSSYECAYFFLVIPSIQRLEVYPADLIMEEVTEETCIDPGQASYVFFEQDGQEYVAFFYPENVCNNECSNYLLRMSVVNLETLEMVNFSDVYECDNCNIGDMDVVQHDGALYVLFSSRLAAYEKSINSDNVSDCSCYDYDFGGDNTGLTCSCSNCEDYGSYYGCYYCNCYDSGYNSVYCDYCSCSNGEASYKVWMPSALLAIKITDPVHFNTESSDYFYCPNNGSYDSYYGDDYVSYEGLCNQDYDGLSFSSCDFLLSNNETAICVVESLSSGPIACEYYDSWALSRMPEDFKPNYSGIDLIFDNNLYFSFIFVPEKFFYDKFEGYYECSYDYYDYSNPDICRGINLGNSSCNEASGQVYASSLIPSRLQGQENLEPNIVYLDNDGLHLGSFFQEFSAREPSGISWANVNGQIKLLFTNGYKLYYMPLESAEGVITGFGSPQELGIFKDYAASSVWRDQETGLIYAAVYDALLKELFFMTFDPITSSWSSEIVADSENFAEPEISLVKSGDNFYLMVRDDRRNDLFLYVKSGDSWSSSQISDSSSLASLASRGDGTALLASWEGSYPSYEVKVYSCESLNCENLGSVSFSDYLNYLAIHADNQNIYLVGARYYCGFLSVKHFSAENATELFSLQEDVGYVMHSTLFSGKLYVGFEDDNDTLKLVVCENSGCNLQTLWSNSDITNIFLSPQENAFSFAASIWDVGQDEVGFGNVYNLNSYHFGSDFSFSDSRNLAISFRSPIIKLYQVLPEGELLFFDDSKWDNPTALKMVFVGTEAPEELTAEINVTQGMPGEYFVGPYNKGIVSLSWEVSYNRDIGTNDQVQDCLYAISGNETSLITCLPQSFYEGPANYYSSTYNGTLDIPLDATEIVLKNFVNEEEIAQASLGTFTVVWVELENPSPANGTADIDPANGLILSWDPVPQAQGYELWIWTEGSQQPQIEVLTTNSYEMQNLAYDTTYYWQVFTLTEQGPFAGEVWTFSTMQNPDSDADGLPDEWEYTYFDDLSYGPNDDPDGDGLTNSEEFERGTNPAVSNAPSRPEIISPENSAELSDTTPLFVVQNSSDPDNDIITYQYEIYADEELTVLVVNGTQPASEGETTSWTISTELESGAWYYWRVRATDGWGYSAWTDLYSFYIAPVEPVLTSLVLEVPEGSVQAGLAFKIKVKALDQDGQLYEAFEGPVSLSVSSGTITPETLTGFVNGLWDGQVIIEDTTGEVVITAEGEGLSAEATVEVTCAAPAAPSLVWPENESTVNSGDMSFTWGAVEGAESYEIEVAADSSFNEILYSREGITTSFVDVSSAELSLEGGVTYYWRVRAVSECGEGAWSEAYTFSVPEVEPQITITTPEDGATLTAGEEITITWDYQGDVGDTVKIRYNTGGRRWSTIATGVPVTEGSYSWTVPNKATTRLRIKIESEQDRTIYDIGGFYTIELVE